MPQSPDQKEGSEIYTFSYVHPITTCPKSSDVKLLVFSAENQHYADVLAENERVICDKCGYDYKLQKP